MRAIRIARQLTDERLTELLDEHGSIKVTLLDLAVAPNPASTKSRIYGPAEVTYVRHPDGGIDTTVREKARGPQYTIDSEGRTRDIYSGDELAL